MANLYDIFGSNLPTYQFSDPAFGALRSNFGGIQRSDYVDPVKRPEFRDSSGNILSTRDLMSSGPKPFTLDSIEGVGMGGASTASIGNQSIFPSSNSAYENYLSQLSPEGRKQAEAQADARALAKKTELSNSQQPTPPGFTSIQPSDYLTPQQRIQGIQSTSRLFGDDAITSAGGISSENLYQNFLSRVGRLSNPYFQAQSGPNSFSSILPGKEDYEQRLASDRAASEGYMGRASNLYSGAANKSSQYYGYTNSDFDNIRDATYGVKNASTKAYTDLGSRANQYYDYTIGDIGKIEGMASTSRADAINDVRSASQTATNNLSSFMPGSQPNKAADVYGSASGYQDINRNAQNRFSSINQDYQGYTGASSDVLRNSIQGFSGVKGAGDLISQKQTSPDVSTQTGALVSMRGSIQTGSQPAQASIDKLSGFSNQIGTSTDRFASTGMGIQGRVNTLGEGVEGDISQIRSDAGSQYGRAQNILSGSQGGQAIRGVSGPSYAGVDQSISNLSGINPAQISDFSKATMSNIGPAQASDFSQAIRPEIAATLGDLAGTRGRTAGFDSATSGFQTGTGGVDQAVSQFQQGRTGVGEAYDFTGQGLRSAAGGSDPRFEAYRQAQIAEFDANAEQQRKAQAEFFQSRGMAGSSAAMNAMANLEKDLARQKNLVTSQVGMQQMSRQDQALRDVSQFAGQGAQLQAGMTGQALNARQTLADTQAQNLARRTSAETAISGQQAQTAAQLSGLNMDRLSREFAQGQDIARFSADRDAQVANFNLQKLGQEFAQGQDVARFQADRESQAAALGLQRQGQEFTQGMSREQAAQQADLALAGTTADIATQEAGIAAQLQGQGFSQRAGALAQELEAGSVISDAQIRGAVARGDISSNEATLLATLNQQKFDQKSQVIQQEIDTAYRAGDFERASRLADIEATQNQQQIDLSVQDRIASARSADLGRQLQGIQGRQDLAMSANQMDLSTRQAEDQTRLAALAEERATRGQQLTAATQANEIAMREAEISRMAREQEIANRMNTLASRQAARGANLSAMGTAAAGTTQAGQFQIGALTDIAKSKMANRQADISNALSSAAGMDSLAARQAAIAAAQRSGEMSYYNMSQLAKSAGLEAYGAGLQNLLVPMQIETAREAAGINNAAQLSDQQATIDQLTKQLPALMAEIERLKKQSGQQTGGVSGKPSNL